MCATLYRLPNVAMEQEQGPERVGPKGRVVSSEIVPAMLVGRCAGMCIQYILLLIETHMYRIDSVNAAWFVVRADSFTYMQEAIQTVPPWLMCDDD